MVRDDDLPLDVSNDRSVRGVTVVVAVAAVVVIDADLSLYSTDTSHHCGAPARNVYTVTTSY